MCRGPNTSYLTPVRVRSWLACQKWDMGEATWNPHTRTIIANSTERLRLRIMKLSGDGWLTSIGSAAGKGLPWIQGQPWLHREFHVSLGYRISKKQKRKSKQWRDNKRESKKLWWLGGRWGCRLLCPSLRSLVADGEGHRSHQRYTQRSQHN